MQLLSKDIWRSRFFKIWIVIVALLVLMAIAFVLWAHDYIDSAYNASVAGHSGTSLIDHQRHTVQYYHERADLIFWQYLFWGIPLTLLFWYLLIRAVRILIDNSRGNALEVEILPYRFKGDTIVAVLLYSALTALYFAPILNNLGTHLLGPPEDNLVGFWAQWWSVDQVSRGTANLTFTQHLFYPDGLSLYYQGWTFYNQGVAFVLRHILGQVATYNVVIMHGYPIAGLGAFLLIRRLTGNSLAALLGGFVFAFSPVHFMRSLHHVHINTLQFVPLFVLYFVAAIRKGGLKNVILAGIFLLLNALSDWNFLIMGGYFVLFGYIYLMLKNRKWWIGSYVVKSVAILACALVPLLFWLVPMIQTGLQFPGADVGGRNTYVADLMSLFIPHVEHLLGNTSLIQSANNTYTGNVWECVGYLGLVAIGLVIVSLQVLIQRAARVWLGLISFLTLALGPQLHFFGKSLPIGLPYTIIAFIPFLKSARAPARFMIYVYLFWAILVSLALLHLWVRQKSGLKRAAIAASVVALLFVDLFPGEVQLTRVPLPGELQLFVESEQPTAFLNLPRGYINTMTYMAQQTTLGVPMVGGAPTRKLGEKLIDRLDFDDLFRQQGQLANAGVSHIVIHKYSLSDSDGFSSLDTLDYILHYRTLLDCDSLIILEVKSP